MVFVFNYNFKQNKILSYFEYQNAKFNFVASDTNYSHC